MFLFYFVLINNNNNNNNGLMPAYPRKRLFILKLLTKNYKDLLRLKYSYIADIAIKYLQLCK